MISIIALLTTIVAPVSAPASVTELSIVPAAGRTEVVIRVDADVHTRDFMMDDGRLVLDFEGVETRGARWDRINRGGVRGLRVAQFQPGVARVVIELQSPVDYEIQREANAVRVSFPNRAGEFSPWTSGDGLAAAPAARPAPQQVTRPEPPRAGTVTQPQRPLAQSITVTFDQVPVPDVLAAFAAMSGRSIIPSPDVRSTLITAEIVNQPWDIALDAILEANNLRLRELASGVLIVEGGSARALRTQTEPVESRQFVIQYVAADSLQSTIGGLLSDQGKVSINRANNAILVTDTRSALERIGPMIEQLDVRTAQINISARIAFVNRTQLQALGFSYDLKDMEGTQLAGLASNINPNTGASTEDDLILLDGNSIAALGNATNRIQEPTLQLALSLVLGRHTLVSFIEALQRVNLTDVQAAPVVTTLDHRAARVQVGQETPVRVVDLGSQTGGLGAARATVEYKQTGVILEVTPHVTGNMVMLEIQAERSQVAPGLSDAGVVFETSNAQTQVLVENGQTAVIAGLTETQRTQERAGIPILMDLPVLGNLFRRTSNEEVQRDLLIMVTPYIIRN